MSARRGAPARFDPDDSGSVMILALGYAMLALVLILICVDATSLYLAQKRLDATADAAALAGADSFVLNVEGGEPVASLTSEAVYEQAVAILGAVEDSATVVSATSPDGVSAQVTVRRTWHPPIVTLFVPEGVALESTATSRTALR